MLVDLARRLREDRHAMPFALSPERERKLQGDPRAVSDEDGRDAAPPAPVPGAGGVRQRRGHRVRLAAPRPLGGPRRGRRHLLHALQPAPGRQAPGLGVPHPAVRAAGRLRRASPTARSASGSTAVRRRRTAR